MEVKDIILKINQLVPQATPQNMLETSLKVTEEGVKEVPPEIIGDVKDAFVKIMKGLSNEKFDEFLQYLIALEYHRNVTVGLHATQVPLAFEQLPQKNLLFELNFPQDLRGWAEPDHKSENNDNSQDDDDFWI
ncbi:hypothetical protein [Desertivirga brevis]|uniref:hypothetical protein n=1 Tax=Desertivirga brevis TaxID=2810310 RepID=UPI001A95A547|nr:hypothetical protein [Pedobacter sp. SYSU D00873]